MKSQKEQLKQAMDALFKEFDVSKMKELYTQDYVQHNPHVPTGLDAVIGLLPALEESGFSYTTHRCIEDGDLLATHTSYSNAEVFGAAEVVAFDIWRMEDGQVAEHWDAIIPKFEETASGRSQVDGPTEIGDLDKTNDNKTLVAQFMKDILMGQNPDRIGDYINQTHYHQHNPQIEDGLEGLFKTINELTNQGNMFKYFKVHRIIGEGNFVLAQSEGEWSDKPTAFYDLFRLKNGQLVEHWDVIQEIPPQMAHTNGMF